MIPIKTNQTIPRTIKSNFILLKNNRNGAKSSPVTRLLINILKKMVSPIDNKSCIIFHPYYKKKAISSIKSQSLFFVVVISIQKGQWTMSTNSLNSDETIHNRANHVALFFCKRLLYINRTQLTPDDSSGTCWHVQILFQSRIVKGIYDMK